MLEANLFIFPILKTCDDIFEHFHKEAYWHQSAVKLFVSVANCPIGEKVVTYCCSIVQIDWSNHATKNTCIIFYHGFDHRK